MNDAPHKPASRFRNGVVMDPIAGIKTWKDSTFAMLLEAQRQIRKARQEILKSQVEAQLRLADIERLLGEDL